MPARASIASVAAAIIFAVVLLRMPDTMPGTAIEAGALTHLSYEEMAVRGMALRFQTVSGSGNELLLDLLTSSPIPTLDLDPLWSFLGWWLQEASKAILIRHSIQ